MDILMPQMGETVAEGTLTVWHKKVGETVTASDILFEIGTDKVEMEVPAQIDGVVKEILVEEGATVEVGSKVAVIEQKNESEAIITNSPDREPQSMETSDSPTHIAISSRDRSMKLSPVVRKLLSDNKLNPEAIAGTGREGRIKRSDVLEYLKTNQPKGSDTSTSNLSEPNSKKGVQVIPFNYRRKLTAEHMVSSKTTSPHVLQAIEVDFSSVDKARKVIGQDWKNREGYSLTYLPFISKAVCSAINDFPLVNGHIENDSLLIYDRVNLAIAIDLNFEGLVAPVIRDADIKAVTEIARATHDLAQRARSDKLSPDEFADATYTISNNGSFGTLITAPIINQPQIAILSTDGVKKRPIVVQNGDEEVIAIRPVGILAQSFDHRGIDGSYSGAFLNRVKEIIEEKNWLDSMR